MVSTLRSLVFSHTREPAEDQILLASKAAVVISISSNFLCTVDQVGQLPEKDFFYHLIRRNGTFPFAISVLSHKVIELTDHIYLQSAGRSFVR